MTDQRVNFLQSGLDAILASMAMFTTNSQDENMHLQLRDIHRAQRNLYTDMAPNDIANRQKYEKWIIVHHTLQETHEVIHNQIHQRNTLVIQPHSRGQDF